MFTQTNIVEKLNFFDINCDFFEVEQLIKELCLEPIFEDEKGQLYYDDEAYELIKNKLQERHPNPSPYETKDAQIVDAESESTSIAVDKPKNIEIIAQTISQRITIDLADFIKKNMSTEEAFKAGIFKRDNEILSKKLQETINDNKKLIEKIHELENENRKYHPIFGGFYVKEK